MLFSAFVSNSPRIRSNGNVNLGSRYVYSDKNYPASAYYRIKAVDIDGKFSLSNTILLKAKNAGELFKLATNPASGNIRLNLFVNQPLSLVLHNNIGQVVYKASRMAGNSRSYTISAQNLPKGMYSITVSDGNKRQTEKVVIQ